MHSWTNDYLKMEGVFDKPPPCLNMLELNVSHEEMDSLTRQVIAVTITSGPPQAEGTSESDGLPYKYCRYTSTSSFQCFPRQHYW
jgi:hypothetical protein